MQIKNEEQLVEQDLLDRVEKELEEALNKIVEAEDRAKSAEKRAENAEAAISELQRIEYEEWKTKCKKFLGEADSGYVIGLINRLRG